MILLEEVELLLKIKILGTSKFLKSNLQNIMKLVFVGITTCKFQQEPAV